MQGRSLSPFTGGAPGPGRALPTPLRRSTEAQFGVGLDAVRIHDDPGAAATARDLGALAFTLDADVYFRGGAFTPESPDGRRLLAHEIAHVLQPESPASTSGPVRLGHQDAEEETQAVAVAGRAAAAGPAAQRGLPTAPRKSRSRVIRRYMDPTQNSYTADVARKLSDADVLAAIDDIRLALAGAGPEAPTTVALFSNLDLLLAQVGQRQLSVGLNVTPRTATSPDQLATPGQINALVVHYEVLDALAARLLGRQASTVRTRIAQRRAWLSALHREAVLPEGALIEGLEVALNSWQQSNQIVPAQVSKDNRISGAEQTLRRALAFGASTLLSNAQQDALVALEVARTDYLSTFATLLLDTANDLRTQLRDPHLRNIPMVSNYQEGILTRTPGGPWEGADDLREYRASLDRIIAALDAHGDLAATATKSPVERLAYLIEHGDQLMGEIGQAQALIVAGQGIALVSYFQDAFSSQERQFDWMRINEMRNDIIEPMISALRGERAPSPTVLEDAQFHLEIYSPAPTDAEGNPDPAAIAEQQRRHRAYREAHHATGDEPESMPRRRLREIAEFNHDFGIFAGIAASIIGAVAAAGAVGALMRTAAFSEGGALAAGQGLRIGAIRFVAQSLTFTLASQTMQAALLGRLPTLSDVGKAAAMDAATLGFMHAIGLPFTRLGQQPPTSLQFGALWAWSSAWQLGGLAWRGQLTLTSGAQAVALGGVETALMLKAMEVAHRIGVLPTPDGLGYWFRPRTVEQSVALQEYLAAQQEGRAIRTDAIAWQRGTRVPEQLEAILERSQGFMGRYRRALGLMETSGLLPSSEIKPIAAQAVAQAAEVRNLHDVMALGLAPAGPGMVTYTGVVEDLLVYLERLHREKSVSQITAIGRAGALEVTYADGTVRYFYPRGARAAPGEPTLLLDSVSRVLPSLQAAQHLTVLESLHRLPVDAAARIVAGAEASASGAEVLRFIARPDVAIELSRPGSLYDEPLLQSALTGGAEALALIRRPESPLALQHWYQTDFARLDPGRGRALAPFFSFLDSVRLYRGTLAVASLGEARAVADALAGAADVAPIKPMALSQGPAISAPGARAPSAPRSSPQDYFLRQGMTDLMLHFTVDGIEWFLSTGATGRPERAWVFAPGTDRPAFEVDVTGRLARLRSGVTQLDTLGPGQDAQARQLIDQLRELTQSLGFFRRMRRFDVSAELTLLDRIELDPRGSRPRAAPLDLQLPGPLTPQTVGPGALLDPVTPSEVLSQRQQALQQRASRMASTGDAAVQSGLIAQIRVGLTLTEQASVRTSLERAEQHLDEVAKAAYVRASHRLGARRFASVVDRVFPGRSKVQVGEALHFMTEQPGYRDSALEALANLPAAQRRALIGLEPSVLSALGDIAAVNPTGAARLLRENAEQLVELQRNPGLAARFVRLVNLLDGRQLLFAEAHRHVQGGIPYPQLLVGAMSETTGLAPPKQSWPPAQVARWRRERLDIESNRLLKLGRDLADALPPGHPGTQAYLTSWEAARPLIEAYREVLVEEIARSVCRADRPVLEDRVTRALTQAFTLPLEAAQRGPQGDLFFPLFRELGGSVKPQPGARAAVAMAASQRVAYVEFRGGSSRDVLNQLESQGLVGPDGQLVPDARIIISIPRQRLRATEVEAELTKLGPSLRSRVVGVDLSGAETAELPAGALLTTVGNFAVRNFTALDAMFTAHPGLRAEVTTRLGRDPVPTGRELATKVTAGAASTAGTPEPTAELSRLNRQVQQVVNDLDARDGTSRLPDTLLGVTVHAGEQVRGARINMLLNDVQTALNAGSDRIGHGIVLGFPLPDSFVELGFTRQPNGSWTRPGPVGGNPETYTPDQVAAMEQQRLALIRRVGDEGVVLEITPTSNIVLSGLAPGAHPLSELMRARPNLRVAIATDNPAIHLTDPARELALAGAIAGTSYPRTVRMYLEGFASRLGSRPIGNAATVRGQVRDALLIATPPAERAEVLVELQARFGIVSGVKATDPLDVGQFADLLEPYLVRVIR